MHWNPRYLEETLITWPGGDQAWSLEMERFSMLGLGGVCASLSELLFFFFSFCLFRAYGSSQARGPIGAVASCLYHSHSNVGSKPRLQPTLQLNTNTGYFTH